MTTAPERARTEVAEALAPERPTGHTTGWWGMMLFLASETMTFGTFLASYFYLWFSRGGPWPPPSDHPPDMIVPAIYTGLLLLGCPCMWFAARAARTGRRGLTGAVFVSLLLGLGFLALQGLDWREEWPDSTLSKDAYGSLFYTITGLHALHVAVGVVMVAFLVAGAVTGHFRSQRSNIVNIVRIYWYFIAFVAVPIFMVVYWTPNLTAP